MRLDNKVAVITGAGRGIGKATALLFAREGASVVVDEIVPERGQATVQEIRNRGGRAHLALCDISQKQQVTRLFDEAEETFGRVDILVNNAIPDTDTLMVNDWKVVEVGFRGTYLCTKEAVERMKKVGAGSVVSISSVNGLGAFGDLPIYAGVKAAVIGMMRTFAVMQGKHQIRFNAICPGSIQTEIWEPLIAKEPGVYERIAGLYPMGKLGQPIDIARASLYLASDEAAFTTGAVFVIDGGITSGLKAFHSEEW